MNFLVLKKTLSNNPDYYCYCEKGFVKVIQEKTRTDLNEFACFKAEGFFKGKEFFAEKIIEQKNDLKEELLAKAKSFDYDNLVEDDCLNELKPIIREAAEFVAKQLLLLRPVIIRFNDDCDGIISGLYVKNALLNYANKQGIPIELKDDQLNSAVYDANDLIWDSDKFLEEKPVLFLLDLGANKESSTAVNEASKKFNVLILDHHPHSEETVQHTRFISPMNTGGTSSHTTGLLAYHFALALAGKANKERVWFSLQSDKSSFRKEKEFKEAVVLDYLSREEYSLKGYEEILESPQKINSLYDQSKRKLEKSVAQTEVKEEKIESVLFLTVNLSKIKKRAYPPKGIVLNTIHNSREKTNELVATVSYSSDTIQFRVSTALWKKGFKATDVIKIVTSEYPQATGGGHEQAAAMRYPEELKNLILEKTLEETKKIIKKITGTHV
ncbi:hypothetical protein HUU53_00900 [Candidatus Micrarchaeota archaeon]|nr:hypothetical protein [Candidatus Micrarchaeota archaeon]